MSVLREAYNGYTPLQRRNIGGIMLYKLGIEFFNGSITTLATDRFNSFQKLGVAQGINQAMQCIRLAPCSPAAIIVFALMTAILLILDAATGGHLKKSAKDAPSYGSWNPNLIFPIWAIAGVTYGMVELIRRVIPADICGGHVMRLRRMDALVHVMYEISGTAGAFATSAAISRFGNNYSFMLSPIFFTLAGLVWYFITPIPNIYPSRSTLSSVEKNQKKKGYLTDIAMGGYLFFRSIWIGAALIFTHRRFIWLFSSYAVALYLHRALENMIDPTFAKRVLNNSAWSQIVVGGSNLGELLGASTVFMLANTVPTPIPWLRLDAIMLNLVWTFPRYAQLSKGGVKYAWILAATNLPISYGWAAGDVSLAAYIQSVLNQFRFDEPNISPLGAVMAFLYSSYIVMNAILSSFLGGVIDDDFTEHKNIYDSLRSTGSIMFSTASVLIMVSTFIPRGSWALNPRSERDLETPSDENGIAQTAIREDSTIKDSQEDIELEPRSKLEGP
ncbi:hypothetical protein BKA62DRAFT_706967 [Auriculariales sp. MPI-PUGE-AT-0066]|nr:hypothetical protein BKA62DRAFT_706967 [Auriculariales sp. MPI-PUGE-AT-0066]